VDFHGCLWLRGDSAWFIRVNVPAPVEQLPKERYRPELEATISRKVAGDFDDPVKGSKYKCFVRPRSIQRKEEHAMYMSSFRAGESWNGAVGATNQNAGICGCAAAQLVKPRHNLLRVFHAGRKSSVCQTAAAFPLAHFYH
jgi:hypothetical protein